MGMCAIGSELPHRAADEEEEMQVPGDAIGGIVGKVINERE